MPFHPYGDMILDDPAGTYTYLIVQLNRLDFFCVELMRRGTNFPSPSHYPADDEIELFGKMIRQSVIANAGYDKASAESELKKEIADSFHLDHRFCQILTCRSVLKRMQH